MEYYKVLEVDVKAGQKDIKNAYFLKLRQFPAEVHPDKFQKIQEAYQVLSDDKKRADYDAYELYGDKIADLKNQAIEAYDFENYGVALTFFEQVLNYLPDDGKTLNLYALTSFNLNDIHTAIEYWKKALTVDGENAVFHYNLGTGYEELEQYAKAIRCYKQAILCNPLSYQVIQHLSALYIYLEDYENAWNIVERTMKKPVVRGELKIVFIQRLVEVATLIDGQFEMKLALKYADKFIDEQPQLKEDLFVGLYNFGLKLFNEKKFKWSLQVIRYALKLNPTDQQTIDFHLEVKDYYVIYTEFDLLVDDKDVPSEFRFKIYTYLYTDDVEQHEIEEANDEVYELCDEYPAIARRGIQRLKREYPAIANDMKKWFEALESLL